MMASRMVTVKKFLRNFSYCVRPMNGNVKSLLMISVLYVLMIVMLRMMKF